MEKLLLIIYIIAIIAAFIFLWLLLLYNKIQFSIIKIEEAEDNLSILLDKKLELIRRMAKTVNDFTKGKHNDLKEILTIEKVDFSPFVLDEKLDKAQVIIIDYLDGNNKLSKKDTILEVKDELYDCNNDLSAAKKYYNENVSLCNQFIKSFPSNIVAFIFKIKEKGFYSEEKEEIFDILKDK